MEEKKNENHDDSNNIIRDLLYLKPKYNIDLFTDISEEKNENSKSIYLKYYNEHTRKVVLNKKGNNKVCSNRYYEKNLDIIKQKEIKNRKQKENEEKIKNQIEKEKHFDYRIKRMQKLYSSKNILNNNNNNIISRESKIKSKNKKSNDLIRSCSIPNKNVKKDISEVKNTKKVKKSKKEENNKKRKINLSFDDKASEDYNQSKYKNSARLTDPYKESYKGVIVITQKKYHKKIKTMIKLSKIYEDELNILKGDKKNNNSEKENNLNKLLMSINDEIEKYKQKINILVIE